MEIEGGARIVPGMWRLPGKALPLRAAIPLLAELTPSLEDSSLCFLRAAAKLVLAMVERGDFAPAEEGSLLRFLPQWEEGSLRCLGGLAELAPDSLLTARFATEDDPVYAVTPRNFALSLTGHAIDVCAESGSPRFETAEHLPMSFWQPQPQPVLAVLVPKEELEEGVPWGVELSFRPVHGLQISYPLEVLKERLAESLFANAPALKAIEALEHRLDGVAAKIPALRRCINMADGKASLNRQELDQLLDHLTLLENEGFVVTLPGLESMQRLSAHVRLVEQEDQASGPRPWFDFQWSVALGGEELSKSEFESLVNARAPVVFLERGPVLLTPRDREALETFAKRDKKEGRKIGFFEALRLKLGGATHLSSTRSIEDRELPPGFVGELRPYQVRGHAWMHFLVTQGFGACLADDMGLGKTIQAIAMMLDWRLHNKDLQPILLVCPVSVLGNWRREIHRFSPEINVIMHHGKGRAREREQFEKELEDVHVILTSYNLLQRDQDLMLSRDWEGVILDEAQNIKNPATLQSQVARKVRGKFRLALTGTPLENRPLDLWSIMDFLNEGLLGSRGDFLRTLEHPIVKQRSRSEASTLARLVRPFVLRRLKTDPDIITDLPEKSEQVVAASLTREQAVLYESVVRKGLDDVEDAGEGIQRRGAILTTLLRLKQVCNHPAHYHGDGSTLPSRSGKLDLLGEMVEEALDEGDRCLVFTQFKEMGTLLKTHIEELIGSEVLFLHGGVPQRSREDMVAKFQSATEDSPHVFVLSLKAGGTGLNLTAANRVFHFDRWWNPAVEDQATDRAFRIGQQRNVFVHKFVCTGTLEERIQVMLERKRDVSNLLLGAGEGWLTELSNDELRKLLILDRAETL
ncbi:MAG: DEAD/DEAH box helicase [Planctomycetota bacterium]|jgi:hypothetical protein